MSPVVLQTYLPHAFKSIFRFVNPDAFKVHINICQEIALKSKRPQAFPGVSYSGPHHNSIHLQTAVKD